MKSQAVRNYLPRTSRNWEWVKFCSSLLLGVLCLVIGACASPIQAVRVPPTQVQADLGRSAVTTGDLSWATRNVLFEHGLFEAFDAGPEEVIAELHRTMVKEGGNPDLLFALSELSFLHGQDARNPEYDLAAAVYAYAFLFPEGFGQAPGRFDPRLRTAADLYNWALTSSFTSNDRSEVILRGGPISLPFGSIEVAFDKESLRTQDRELYQLTPTSELEVDGLAMRYRMAGLGSSLAASTRPINDSQPSGFTVAPRLKVPLTALLRIPKAREKLVRGDPLKGTLEVHLAWDDESVSIAGEQVPLENEPTAALALTFSGIPIMELELLRFLGRMARIEEPPPLVSATPYHPGLIPVVFVHGTASSPLRWGEMYNRLIGDPQIRRRFQFWFFQYNSGNPVALSSLRLREALTGAVAQIDPNGHDPALNRMVLIGHSQGGLLVKMQAISTEDRLWDAVSRKPIEELELSDTTRELLKKAFFLDPVPQVSRVVFIATPHRGSFIAGRKFIGNLVRRLLTPAPVSTQVAADIFKNRDAVVGFPVVPTAVDNMSPRHPFIKGLQNIPVAPSIKAHSIIAVEGDGPIEEGDDGVVEYTSAHIDGVESELVVRSSHSTQGNPHTIEEVRRILLLHAGLR
jgi:pimeloyl-ACP methyl ester carboxylesterase